MPNAARVSDQHVCPTADHKGGPILAGSPSVLMCDCFASRLGDKLQCCGSQDVIAAGSKTVFINHQPAARVGDATAHGGTVTSGCRTVEIG